MRVIALSSSSFSIRCYVVFVLALLARLTRTAPISVGYDDDSSAEDDESYSARSDVSSNSALRHESAFSGDESEIQSSDLSTEAPFVDDVSNVDLSLLDERPQKTGENSLSALQHVYDNADQFSQKFEKAVAVVDNKITDWSKRISDIKYHIMGSPDGQNGNGYNGGPYGDSYNFQGNQVNNGGLISIVSACNSTLPFFKKIGSMLSKLFEHCTSIARILFVRRVPRTSARSRQKPRMRMAPGPVKYGSEVPGPGSGLESVPVKTKSKGTRARKQQSKGRSRSRSNAGARRRTRLAMNARRNTHETPAYDVQGASDVPRESDERDYDGY